MDKVKHNQYNKKWAKENRDKVNIYQQNWRKKRYDWYQSFKKGKHCIFCSESYPACLDFHHKYPQKKYDVVYKLVKRFSSNNVIALREIKKCVLICANCHRKIHR